MDKEGIKVFSYGGGVQSTAALVLAVQGEIPYATFIFCNVGDNAENPLTLSYVRDVATPYAHSKGINLLTLQRQWQHKERKGIPVDLYSELVNPASRTVGGIPVRMGKGGAPGNRNCTREWKVKVVERWLRQNGGKEVGAVVGIGISIDEWQRMRKGVDPKAPWKSMDYPLIDLGLDRNACVDIIVVAGLPVPPKSSCYFCPFHTTDDWINMANKQPSEFLKACELEKLMRNRASKFGVGDIWFSQKCIPLPMVVQNKASNEDEDICDSGYCFM